MKFFSKYFYFFIYLLLMIFVYTILPISIYWKMDSLLIRAVMFFYSISVSLIFLYVYKKHVKKDFSIVKKVRNFRFTKHSKLILVFLVIFIAIKLFTIYYNPIWMISDETFHLHRGEALLFYTAQNTGLLGSGFNISTEQIASSFDRYPPLSAVVQSLSYVIFGGISSLPYTPTGGFSSIIHHFYLDELAVRLPALVFTVLTFLVMLKLTSLFYDRKRSFLASASLLFFPSYFMLSSTAHLTAGIIFFIVLIGFFAMKFVLSKNQKYLMFASLATMVGCLYERPILVFLGLVPLYLLLLGPDSYKERVKYTGKYILVSLLAILPYYVTDPIFSTNYRPFTIVVTGGAEVLSYLYTLPFQVTIPFAVFSILGLIFVSRKNKLSQFCLLWFIIWYGVLLLEAFTGTRMVDPYLPALAILSSDFIITYSGRLFSWLKIKTSTKNVLYTLLIFVLIAFLAFQSLYVFMGTYDERNNLNVNFYGTTVFYDAAHSVNNNKFPYREVASYLMPKLSQDENLVLVTPSKLAFFDMEDIFKFYLENMDGILTRTVYPFYEDSSKLHIFCLENNIRYIIIPYIEPVHYDKTHYTDQDMQKLSSVISFIESSGLFKKDYSASSGYNHFFVYSVI